MNKSEKFDIPIVIFGYKRNNSLSKLLDKIHHLNPAKLYVFLDGPKNENERKLTEKVYQTVKSIKFIGKLWIKKSEANLGLRKSIESGLDLVFSKEDRAIIIEDDLDPDPSFFYFCKELLDIYQTHPRVISIAGYNSLGDSIFKNTYSFSKYVESWGWATWKTKWDLYKKQSPIYEGEPIESELNKILQKKLLINKWKRAFSELQYHEVDSWAYHWQLTAFTRNMYTAIPSVNMIKYLGNDLYATHTLSGNKIDMDSISSIEFPLIHPKAVEIGKTYENSREINMMKEEFITELQEFVRSPISKTKKLIGII